MPKKIPIKLEKPIAIRIERKFTSMGIDIITETSFAPPIPKTIPIIPPIRQIITDSVKN